MTAMDSEFADLLPLFVAEARDRLVTLAALTARLAHEPGAVVELRRELHTLKGASRMLSLTAIATLCHAAEELLQGGSPPGALLTRVVDALAAMVDEVAAGNEPQDDAGLLAELAPGRPAEPPAAVSADTAAVTATTTPAASTSTPAPARSATDEALDEAADHALALRIRARGMARFATRLEELAALAERGVNDAGPAQVLAVLIASLRREALALARSQRALAWAADAELDALLALQMQPLRPFFLSLARHARTLARELGKEVEVAVAGEATTLDRRIVTQLEEAVLHVVRNAVDHGIEPPAERQAAGKPRGGTVRLEAAPCGSRVRLTIADDGAGIDSEAVVLAAVERGLLPKDAHPTPEEALQLLLRPGFSTRTAVSPISGRGVGLDVVAAVANRLGGELSLTSRRGYGTTVTLEVPAARRGERIFLARVGPVRFGIPAAAVQRLEPLAAAHIQRQNGRCVAVREGETLPFLPLAETFGLEPAARQMLLIGSSAGEPLAVAVDSVEGEEEVLVRPTSVLGDGAGVVDGLAILASGEPVAVLSPRALAPGTQRRVERLAMPPPARRRLRVLLVEDSFVTREMERRLLEDAGFEVVGAASAPEALEALAQTSVDCVVTDIEMPEMDGLEFTRRLRADPAWAVLPVVVVSTRSRREDRLAALQAGADAYFVKQGLDALELVAMVRRLCGR